MKSTGIVRRIDNLGRVVIPKEIRERFHIKDDDPLEIFTEDDFIIFIEDDKIFFRKYTTSDGKNEAVETLQEWLRDNPSDDTFTQIERIMFNLLLKKIAGKG